MSNISKLAMTLGMKFGPVRKGVTPRRVLEYVLNDMIMVQADSSLASDPAVITRHEGMLDAYKNVAHFIAPYTNSAAATPARATRGAAKAAASATKSVKG